MKSPAKKIIMAIIFGAIFLDAGLLFAQNEEEVRTDDEVKIYASEDEESAERRKEFWDKLRESVTPREKEPPKEVRPNEVKPKEKKPKEAK